MRCLCSGFEAKVNLCGACATDLHQNAADLNRRPVYAMPVQRIFARLASARVTQARYGDNGATPCGALVKHTSHEKLGFEHDGGILWSETSMVGSP